MTTPSTEKLVVGTAPMGDVFRRSSQDEANALVSAALDGGVELFDTAPLYGYGLAEHRLGISLRGVARTDFAISTKVGRILTRRSPGGDFDGCAVDFSERGIRSSLEASLERLGVDSVEIALLHDCDEHWEQASTEGIGALRRLRDEGLVATIGVGMNQAPMVTTFITAGLVDTVLIAGRLTLLDQTASIQLLPAAETTSTSVMCGGVFNSGILADPVGNTSYAYGPAPAEIVARARRLAGICAGFGVPVAAAAIRYPLMFRGVTHVVLGLQDVAELDVALTAFATEVPDALWAELETLEQVCRPGSMPHP